MSTHTPGPWRVEESSHKQEFSHWIGSLSRHIMPRQSTIAGVVNAGAESEGNARLIAAAPELLDTLIQVRDSLRGFVRVPGETFKNEIAWMNAAIAKAEGAK